MAGHLRLKRSDTQPGKIPLRSRQCGICGIRDHSNDSEALQEVHQGHPELSNTKEPDRCQIIVWPGEPGVIRLQYDTHDGAVQSPAQDPPRPSCGRTTTNKPSSSQRPPSWVTYRRASQSLTSPDPHAWSQTGRNPASDFGCSKSAVKRDGKSPSSAHDLRTLQSQDTRP